MKRFFYITAVFLLIVACGADPIPVPEAAVLQGPENLNTCTTASSVNSTQSRVTLSWLEANNAESYDVIVRNETTGVELSNNDIIIFETSFVLDKGAPFSWWVISKSAATSETTKSSVWSFYLEGVETPTYIPFPASLLEPANEAVVDLASSTSYTFEWQGNDLDDDIDYYDLRLGTDANNLATVASNISGTSTSATLQSGATYYWQVITVDSQGSSSESVVGAFTTL